MLVMLGTVPASTGLYVGQVELQGNRFLVAGKSFSVERGTAAMAASAAAVCEFYGLPAPLCIFGGDTGDAVGTGLMFEEAINNLDKYLPKLIVLHYLFPKVSFGQPFMQKVDSLVSRPRVVADAGGMYLLKTIGRAGDCYLFTPDEGELYFLADQFAPHPLYVRRELLNKKMPALVLAAQAYRAGNAAKTLIVKGAIDYVYRDGLKIAEVSEPSVPAMEAVGGTGDTITGMVAALLFKGDPDAEVKALRLNRLIGSQINCSPATQIGEFITAIPNILKKYA
jgi:ADP-dependent NAD(P)H-hydrate dehydratase / NAD(P)H-hydrate epimerase